MPNRSRPRAIGAALVAVAIAVVSWLHWHPRRSLTLADHWLPAPALVATGPVVSASTSPFFWLVRGFRQRRIAGVVTLDGRPIAGASVGLGSKLTQNRADRIPTIVTDAAGHFDFGPRLPLAYIVTADAPHLTGTAVAIDLLDSQASSEQLELILAPCDASLHGTIYDNAGGTIARAEVMRYDAKHLLPSTSGTVSDDHGAYELCVSPVATSFEVSADGYASVIEKVGGYGTTTHDFTLHPGATIVGHVVRANDHQPVAGAILTLRTQTYPSASYATSGADGSFRFEGVVAGRHSLTARSDGLATRNRLNPIASVGAPADDVICELEPTVAIEGTVIDHTTKAPQPDVELSMDTLDQLGPQQFVGHSRTDGTFVLDVPPGDYLPMLEQGVFSNDPPLKLQAHQNVRGVVLELDAAGSIAGHVTRGGRPLAGVRVTAASALIGHDHTVTSRADGSYLFTGLAPTDYAVRAQADRLGASAAPRDVKLDPGGHENLDLDLDLAASVAGVVVDQQGQPVRGAFVRFTLLHGHDDAIATTSDDGRFRADAMSGGGEYAVQVQRTADEATATGDRFPPVTVKDGSSAVTGVRIVVNLEAFAIAGRVLDDGGRPVPDITVTAGAREWREQAPFQATSDQHGAFTIRDLRAGSYDLWTNAPGGGEAQSVPAGKSDIVIRIATPGAIEGTLEGFGERPEVVMEGKTFNTGRMLHPEMTAAGFRERSLAPGEYTITAASATGYANATVSVAAGGTAKVAVRSSGFGSIVGTFTDATHKPIAGDLCLASSTLPGAPFRVDPPSGKVDASGAFRIEGVPAVEQQLTCAGPGDQTAELVLTVVRDRATRVDLVAGRQAPRAAATAGLDFEQVFTEMVISSVTPGGPGARAGAEVGDLVVSVDDVPVAQQGFWIVRAFTYEPPGTVVKLGVLRGGKQLQLTLALEATNVRDR